jgi:Spy/CpxP family protein refolding chaperone
MDNSARNEWQVRLAALAIFIIGFVAGALALHVYRGQSWGSSSARHERFQQMLERLDLTPDQQTRVKAILDNSRAQLTEMHKECGPKFRAVRNQTDEQLRAVLTPEQWNQFQQMMSEARERHRRTTDTRIGGP